MYKRQTEYITSIINAMSDMVRVIGRDGKVLMTNSAFDERFGYEEGMECYAPFHQDARCERCLSREVILTGETQRLTRKPVSYTHLDVYKRQISDTTVSAVSNKKDRGTGRSNA